MSVITGDWPSADLDPVRRLRILVAGMPRAAFRERVLEAPFDDIWRVAGDLERGTPRWKQDVIELAILEQDGEHLEVEIRSHFGIRQRLSAVLRPGWCVMQGPLLAVGMAAAPESERTRFAHFETLRFPGSRVLRPLLRHRMLHALDALERVAQTPW